MRSLVLGGSQFVGARLVDHLVRAGHDVSVLNRGRSAPSRPRVRHLVGDRRDTESMRTALQGGEWDVVFDVSGYVMATDAVHFDELVDLLDGRIGRYVFVSSVMAYAPTGDVPWSEDAPVRAEPVDTYGGFKVHAERTLLDRRRTTGLEVAVARPAAIYGPENNIFDMETAMFLRLRQGRPILVPHAGLVTMSYGHVDDLCAALLSLAENPRANGEIVNITGGAVTSIRYVTIVAEVVGVEPDIVLVPDRVTETLSRPPYSRLFQARHHGVASTEKARAMLGLPHGRDLALGHQETYQWFLGSRLADAEANLQDPLWGKGFDFDYEAEILVGIR